MLEGWISGYLSRLHARTHVAQSLNVALPLLTDDAENWTVLNRML